jgi:hypothetical protein
MSNCSQCSSDDVITNGLTPHDYIASLPAMKGKRYAVETAGYLN